jgi:hypothetical protein
VSQIQLLPGNITPKKHQVVALLEIGRDAPVKIVVSSPLFLRAILDQPEIGIPCAEGVCVSQEDVAAIAGLLDGEAHIISAPAEGLVPLLVPLGIGLDQPEITPPAPKDPVSPRRM